MNTQSLAPCKIKLKKFHKQRIDRKRNVTRNNFSPYALFYGFSYHLLLVGICREAHNEMCYVFIWYTESLFYDRDAIIPPSSASFLLGKERHQQFNIVNDETLS